MRTDAHRRADKKYYYKMCILLKKKLFTIYKPQCICCKLTSRHNLTFDHKIPLKGKKRNTGIKLLKEVINGKKDDYQILCFGCNISKRTGIKCILNHFS